MTRITLLAPAADSPYADFWPPYFERYAAALAPVGLVAEPLPWTRAGETDADAVMPLLTWGYHLETGRWLATLDALAASGVRTLNSAAMLRWNTTKTYLADLEDADVPVVPTIFVDRATQKSVEEARELLGGGELVVKPQISGGSHETIRLAPGAVLENGPTGPAMIQPFLPSVSGEGELSLLHFGGVFSHAVGKVARADDFRVQPQFGSTIGPAAPSDEAMEVAAAVFAALDETPVYARVDLIRHLDGSLRVMELEAIEPDLFFEHCPEAGARFAAAVKAALG
jgi:glutathione synthase/RimK-type ligase-like ATP-grasp enzyme